MAIQESETAIDTFGRVLECCKPQLAGYKCPTSV